MTQEKRGSPDKEWLALIDEGERTFTRLIHEFPEKTTGNEMAPSLKRYFLRQSLECQKALTEVFAKWIREGDIVRGGVALMMIEELKLRTQLGLLMDTLKDIQQGRSNWPSYYATFFESAIRTITPV